ncbi:hypothetical protein [Tenacibaculum litopenaei]|uniref:hypothetical protein n=1 Tax=Tenacibaculum litopenaei TaxID=396016 RepID=UPI0038B43C0F
MSRYFIGGHYRQKSVFSSSIYKGTIDQHKVYAATVAKNHHKITQHVANNQK